LEIKPVPLILPTDSDFKPKKIPFSFAYSEIFANFAHNHQQYVWAQMQPLACAFYLD
jgi:hypothetical protein